MLDNATRLQKSHCPVKKATPKRGTSGQIVAKAKLISKIRHLTDEGEGSFDGVKQGAVSPARQPSTKLLRPPAVAHGRPHPPCVSHIPSHVLAPNSTP